MPESLCNTCASVSWYLCVRLAGDHSARERCIRPIVKEVVQTGTRSIVHSKDVKDNIHKPILDTSGSESGDDECTISSDSCGEAEQVSTLLRIVFAQCGHLLERRSIPKASGCEQNDEEENEPTKLT